MPLVPFFLSKRSGPYSSLNMPKTERTDRLHKSVTPPRSCVSFRLHCPPTVQGWKLMGIPWLAFSLQNTHKGLQKYSWRTLSELPSDSHSTSKGSLIQHFTISAWVWEGPVKWMAVSLHHRALRVRVEVCSHLLIHTETIPGKMH